MKKKHRKLRLNRETLRELESGDLRGVAGGATENPTRCDPNSNCVTCDACTETRTCDTCRPCRP
jgi:hypothetical protein